MENKFRVALLQLNSINDINKSLNKGEEACRRAKELGADIAVFPEMWSIGYEMPYDEDSIKNNNYMLDDKIKKWKYKAIDDNDIYLLKYKRLAKELDMAIAITYLEKTDDLPKNSVIIYDRFGNIVLKYSKVHTVDFKVEKYIKPGTDFFTNILDYKRGKLNIGAMICFDRDFPESARILMLKGAEIIIVPNACYMSKIRLEQLKVRAYENMVGIVTVNYANLGGKSSAFSPIVRDISKNEVDSELLVMDNNENIKVIEFDMKLIREYRNRETLGDSYRKPLLYKYICEEHVREPFIRKDSRRELI